MTLPCSMMRRMVAACLGWRGKAALAARSRPAWITATRASLVLSLEGERTQAHTRGHRTRQEGRGFHTPAGAAAHPYMCRPRQEELLLQPQPSRHRQHARLMSVQPIRSLYEQQDLKGQLRRLRDVFQTKHTDNSPTVEDKVKAARDVYLAALGMKRVHEARERVQQAEARVQNIKLDLDQKIEAREVASQGMDAAYNDLQERLRDIQKNTLFQGRRGEASDQALSAFFPAIREATQSFHRAEQEESTCRAQLDEAMSEYIEALAGCQEAEQQQFEADSYLRYYTFLLSILGILPILFLAYTRREAVASAIRDRLTPFLDALDDRTDDSTIAAAGAQEGLEQRNEDLLLENEGLKEDLTALKAQVQETTTIMDKLAGAWKDERAAVELLFQTAAASAAVLGLVAGANALAALLSRNT